MPSLGDLVVNLTANTRQFTASMSRAGATLSSFARNSLRALTDLRTIIAGAAVTSLAGGMIKLAAEAETLTVQMEVLTGSATQAKRVMSDVGEFAASTPFQKLEIAEAARSLLAFGSSSESVVSELRMLGDISAATGTRLGDIAEIFGKARVQGRLFGEDINQLTGRGIPVIGALAKQFGVAESEVKKLVTEGKVGFPELQKALQSMTEAGGKFSGMMERLSETTAGKFSTAKDNFAELATELGSELLPAVNEILIAMLDLAKVVNGIGDSVKSVRVYFSDLSIDLVIFKRRVEQLGNLMDPFNEGGPDNTNQIRNLLIFQRKERDRILGIKPMEEQIGDWQAMQLDYHAIAWQFANGISMGWKQGMRDIDVEQLVAEYNNAISMSKMFNAFSPNPSAGVALKQAIERGGKPLNNFHEIGDAINPKEFIDIGNFADLMKAMEPPDAPELQFAEAAEKGSSSAFDMILSAMRGNTKSAEAQGIDKLNMTVKKEVGEPLKKLADADAGFIIVEAIE